jgi:hypothetical protein
MTDNPGYVGDSDAEVSDCVLWAGVVNNKGYGVARYGNTTTTAHRLAWMRERGQIPDGLQVDHLCRNRLCVNVAHMELVTPRENTRRAPWSQVTECRNGHPLSGDNLRIQIQNGRIHRACRTCQRTIYAKR